MSLIPTRIATRDELNRAERETIAVALRWAHRRRFDVRNADRPLTLHIGMSVDLRRWAGALRTSKENIGEADRWALEEYLHALPGDVRVQVEYGAHDADAIALDFHHRVVPVHLFPNGDGR